MGNKVKNVIDRVRTKQLVPIKCSVENGHILDGKAALVSGGSGDIGKAIAAELARQGCLVILSGTNRDKLEKNCSEIEGSSYITMDLRDIESLDAKIEEAEKAAGKPIDILVNASGIGGKFEFGKVTEEEYDRVMNVNLKGAYFLCQAMGNYMIARRIKGHILNVSSASALRPAWTPYHISKWAIKGFTVGLAEKLLPHGIIVNAIAPGPVATGMLGKKEGDSIEMPSQPSGRYALPEEIASMAAYLVSDLGSLIVGDTIYMTGGSGIISLHH